MASSDHEATLMSQYAAEEIAMLMEQNQRYEDALRHIAALSHRPKLWPTAASIARAALAGNDDKENDPGVA